MHSGPLNMTKWAQPCSLIHALIILNPRNIHKCHWATRSSRLPQWPRALLRSRTALIKSTVTRQLCAATMPRPTDSISLTWPTRQTSDFLRPLLPCMVSTRTELKIPSKQRCSPSMQIAQITWLDPTTPAHYEWLINKPNVSSPKPSSPCHADRYHCADRKTFHIGTHRDSKFLYMVYESSVFVNRLIHHLVCGVVSLWYETCNYIFKTLYSNEIVGFPHFHLSTN